MQSFYWGIGSVVLVIALTTHAVRYNILDEDSKYLQRIKRSGRGYARGQTQSQYLNYGKPEMDGKAEAEANESGSRSTVFGTHGMGQAQSQFSSSDCTECPGTSVYDYSSGSPDPLTLGGTTIQKQPFPGGVMQSERPQGAADGTTVTRPGYAPSTGIGIQQPIQGGTIPSSVGLTGTSGRPISTSGQYPPSTYTVGQRPQGQPTGTIGQQPVPSRGPVQPTQPQTSLGQSFPQTQTYGTVQPGTIGQPSLPGRGPMQPTQPQVISQPFPTDQRHPAQPGTIGLPSTSGRGIFQPTQPQAVGQVFPQAQTYAQPGTIGQPSFSSEGPMQPTQPQTISQPFPQTQTYGVVTDQRHQAQPGTIGLPSASGQSARPPFPQAQTYGTTTDQRPQVQPGIVGQTSLPSSRPVQPTQPQAGGQTFPQPQTYGTVAEQRHQAQPGTIGQPYAPGRSILQPTQPQAVSQPFPKTQSYGTDQRHQAQPGTIGQPTGQTTTTVVQPSGPVAPPTGSYYGQTDGQTWTTPQGTRVRYTPAQPSSPSYGTTGLGIPGAQPPATYGSGQPTQYTGISPGYAQQPASYPTVSDQQQRGVSTGGVTQHTKETATAGHGIIGGGDKEPHQIQIPLQPHGVTFDGQQPTTITFGLKQDIGLHIGPGTMGSVKVKPSIGITPGQGLTQITGAQPGIGISHESRVLQQPRITQGQYGSGGQPEGFSGAQPGMVFTQAPGSALQPGIAIQPGQIQLPGMPGQLSFGEQRPGLQQPGIISPQPQQMQQLRPGIPGQRYGEQRPGLQQPGVTFPHTPSTAVQPGIGIQPQQIQQPGIPGQLSYGEQRPGLQQPGVTFPHTPSTAVQPGIGIQPQQIQQPGIPGQLSYGEQRPGLQQPGVTFPHTPGTAVQPGIGIQPQQIQQPGIPGQLSYGEQRPGLQQPGVTFPQTPSTAVQPGIGIQPQQIQQPGIPGQLSYGEQRLQQPGVTFPRTPGTAVQPGTGIQPQQIQQPGIPGQLSFGEQRPGLQQPGVTFPQIGVGAQPQQPGIPGQLSYGEQQPDRQQHLVQPGFGTQQTVAKQHEQIYSGITAGGPQMPGIQSQIGFQPGVGAQAEGATYGRPGMQVPSGSQITQPDSTAYMGQYGSYGQPTVSGAQPGLSYGQPGTPGPSGVLQPGAPGVTYVQPGMQQPGQTIIQQPPTTHYGPTSGFSGSGAQQQGMTPYGIAPPQQMMQPGVGYTTQQTHPSAVTGAATVPSGLITSPASMGGTDDAFSQAETSISNGQASASAEGKKHGGAAKTQVQGTYSSSGSFTASAMTSDNDRSASSQVSGNSEGAMSQAQGQGGAAQSQAQVQVNEKTGGTKASSQSGGLIHQSQSEVQANDKGGLADAQSSGPGQTSSQAQIGFRPGQDGQVVQSAGGGQASAQSGTHSGQSQSQIQGTSKFGVSYHGAAQSASGTKEQVATYREQNRNLFNSISQFGGADAVTDRVDTMYNPALTSDSDHIPDLQLKSSRASNTNKLDNDDDLNEPYEDEEEPYDEYEEEDDYYNDSLIKMNSKSSDRTTPKSNQNGKNLISKMDTVQTPAIGQQTQQQAIADFSKKRTIVQSQKNRPRMHNYDDNDGIPNGFRGTVNVEKKFHTKALEPLGKVNATASDNEKSSAPSSPSKPISPDSYVTVTKSITGSMDNSKNPAQDNKNFQSTYYTKSSTCGYFTFSCNIVYGANGRSKICRPKAPTNGKC